MSLPPLVSLTGFGPFAGVERNASEALVQDLAARPPGGLRLAVRVLPVDYRAAAEALEDHWAALDGPPRALIATGVHRGTSLRLERRARRDARSEAPDNAGRAGGAAALAGDWPLEYATALDLGRVERALDAPEVTHSDDAGGYLCERVYYLTLRHAARLGVPALFVHVPGVDKGPPEALRAPFERLLHSVVDPG